MKFLWALLLVATIFYGCGLEQDAESTLVGDILEQAKQDPTGNWQLTEIDTDEVYTFTVSDELMDHNAHSIFVASGEVRGRSLVGFIVTTDPRDGQTIACWLGREVSGELIGETNKVLGFEEQNIILGGNQEHKNRATAKLTRLE